MPIPVTCPSCLTRFAVSDKFAGKSGPCPKCKSTIKIPEKTEEVVIHAPADKAPKDSKGRSILKPIRREDIRLSLPTILTVALTGISLFGVALGFGLGSAPPPTVLLVLVAPLLALGLVYGGYWFLHDDELQGFAGRELWLRCGICALIFALSWLLYRWVPAFVHGHQTAVDFSVLDMFIMVVAMIALGSTAAVLSLELEVAQGVLLYMLYFITSFVLVWLSGTPLGEVLPGHGELRPAPARVQPADPSVAEPSVAEPAAVEPAAVEPPRRSIPNLLQ